MKQIKLLGIKTQEGFEVRNLKRFPSMEWGEEGGLQADVYYNGIKIMQVFQEGNGGCAITYPEQYYRDNRFMLDQLCLDFLKRVDRNYGPQSEYGWLKSMTVARLDDDEWEALVNNIEEYYDDVRAAADIFRKGYKTVVALKKLWQTDYLQYKVSDVTETEVNSWLIKNDTNKEYIEYKILRPVETLNIL